MSDKVRLGFVGCGGIVRSHLEQGLKDFDDVEFAGWCDLNEETAAARKAQVGGQGEVFTDARLMLDAVKPDAVYIMLPPYAHGEVEKLVIERRLPFFIEKPVAIDVPTARRVRDAVHSSELITSVGYMTRYRESVQRVKRLLDGQKPVLAHGGWVGGGMDPYSAIGQWWVRKEQSGGQFLEQTTHTTDLIRYLFGEVETVHALAVKDRLDHPDFFTIEDASMVQLGFANGAAACLYSSCSTPVGGGIWLTVWGTALKAEFTGWEHSVTIELPDQETTTIPGEENILASEDRAFIDSVKAGQDRGILADYEDGYQAVVIGCAANESMQTGQPVRISD